jgi:hypothetical protein
VHSRCRSCPRIASLSMILLLCPHMKGSEHNFAALGLLCLHEQLGGAGWLQKGEKRQKKECEAQVIAEKGDVLPP